MKMNILKLLLALLLLAGCTSGSFKGESRGNTMKRYLHYCTYEIWDGFKEFINYEFSIIEDVSHMNIEDINFRNINYINISLEEFPPKDKLDELIDFEITKHKAELKKYRKDEYFSEISREKIKIGDNSAVVVSYEFNEACKKGESDFNYYLQKVENCYIKLKDKAVVIKGKTFSETYKGIQPLWEEFYRSYKSDMSQTLKTNYGSFKWVKGLKDNSTIKYFSYDAKMQPEYIIELSYVYEDEMNEINHNSSFIEKTIDVLTFNALVRKIRSDTIRVDGYKIVYDEIDATISNGQYGKMGEVKIFDFTPGIYINIREENGDSLDMYRNEINAMINSIKFYPNLKKD